MFTINSVLPILKNNNPCYISITKEAFSSFTYGAATGYQAFLAWVMDIGNYIQGDLAVWHWADVCRFIEHGTRDRKVIFVIQNTEYAIIATENLSNQLIEFSKIKIDVINKEIYKKSHRIVDESSPYSSPNPASNDLMRKLAS